MAINVKNVLGMVWMEYIFKASQQKKIETLAYFEPCQEKKLENLSFHTCVCVCVRGVSVPFPPLGPCELTKSMCSAVRGGGCGAAQGAGTRVLQVLEFWQSDFWRSSALCCLSPSGAGVSSLLWVSPPRGLRLAMPAAERRSAA